MNVLKIKCPICSNITEFELDKDFMFCKYCANKLFKNDITLDNVISIEKDVVPNVKRLREIEEARKQLYFEKWMELYNLQNKKDLPYYTYNFFEDFDLKYNNIFYDDYRRLFCNAVLLTDNFSGVKEFQTTEDPDDYEYHDYHLEGPSIITRVSVGGLNAYEKLENIKNAIKSVKDEPRAIRMANKIDNQLKLIKETKSRIIKENTNIINVQLIKTKKKSFLEYMNLPPFQ